MFKIVGNFIALIMLNIILFGPPGAGKGTQSDLLMSRYSLNYLSTGDALRKEIKNGTSLGLKARSIIESGGLVDDEIIVQIIGNALTGSATSDGWLFDGFPRTYVQAYMLDGLFTRLQTALTRIFILEVPDEQCVQRLLQRAHEQGRSDDNEVVIKRRLEEYHRKTLPLLEFYSDSGILSKIDGMGSADEVFERINLQLNEDLKKRKANVILFGYPGSGRATQAAKLAADFDLTIVSTGELLQNEVKTSGSLAAEVAPLLEKGLLVPDEIVIRLIEKKLRQSQGQGRGFIFKGYPRTLVQAYILDGLLRKQGSGVSCVINLKVPVFELIRRLDARSRTHSSMPYDGSAATIVARLQEHEERTEPVLEYYASKSQVLNVDAKDNPENVYSMVKVLVSKAIRSLR